MRACRWKMEKFPGLSFEPLQFNRCRRLSRNNWWGAGRLRVLYPSFSRRVQCSALLNIAHRPGDRRLRLATGLAAQRLLVTLVSIFMREITIHIGEN